MSYHKPESSQSIIAANVKFDHNEIYAVVDKFYRRVSEHPSLQVPFQSVHDWPEHIDRMTQFWWLRFGGKPYMYSQYNPIHKHFHAGFNKEYLSYWLELFHQVLDEELNKEQVLLWKDLSSQMGQGLLIRNEMLNKK